MLPKILWLSQFWQIKLQLDVYPRVVKILREGYVLPFKTRPLIARSPVVVTGYVHGPRNPFLMNKNSIEKVQNIGFLAFYN